jgi:hypothetical protein
MCLFVIFFVLILNFGLLIQNFIIYFSALSNRQRLYIGPKYDEITNHLASSSASPSSLGSSSAIHSTSFPIQTPSIPLSSSSTISSTIQSMSSLSSSLLTSNEPSTTSTSPSYESMNATQSMPLLLTINSSSTSIINRSTNDALSTTKSCIY